MAKTYWLIFVIILWGALHSTLASIKVKSFLMRYFGSVDNRYYRLLYNIFALLSFLPIIALIIFSPDKNLYIIKMPWMIITILVQISALGAILVAAKQTGVADFIGLNSFLSKENNTQSVMKSGGLYKYVRHPIYSAGLVLIWFAPVMTANYFILAVCLSIYVIIGATFEERKLLFEFGEAYRIYQQEVPMLFPRFRWNK